MEEITFKNIYTSGQSIYENNLYRHYHYPEMLLIFDSNFIDFTVVPSLTAFKEAEAYLQNFHLKRGQKHVKFYFPESEKPDSELMNYFSDSVYNVGYDELYAIQPDQFPRVNSHPDIDIQIVTNENVETYLNLQYETDLQFGEDFARHKNDMHKRNFIDHSIQQIMAVYKGVPAGSVDVILKEETAEIDGLSVKELFQKKGIGVRLQQFVMEKFFNKTVILVADGQDTPREMYRKQNYHYLGFKYHVLKVHN